MTTMSAADKSLSQDPLEGFPLITVTARLYQTSLEGDVSGSVNRGDGDAFRVEGEEGEEDDDEEEDEEEEVVEVVVVESSGIVVDEPRLSPPMNKRKKFKLSDLNVSKPKKKVASTFFGTVSVVFRY